MYVRLAFAVAAHLDPDILLVDEVLAVGDADFQKKCLGKMGDVAQEGRTILFVSHNMGAINALCKRVIFLERGRLKKSGISEEVVSEYLMPDKIILPEVNLMDHPNRKRGMTPVISRLKVRNDSFSNTNYFGIGESVIFDVLLDPGNMDFRSPSLSISVLDSMGNRIVKLATWAQGSYLGSLKTLKTVRCVWRDCRLAPGRYFVNVGFGNGGVTVDSVEQAAVMEISYRADEYPTGRIPPGVFLPKVEWAIENEI